MATRPFTLCHTVWFKATKFGTAIHLGEGGFFQGSPRLGLASNLVCLASASSCLPRPLPCLASVKDIAALPRPLPLPRQNCLEPIPAYTYAKKQFDSATTFDTVTRMGKERVSRGQSRHACLPSGWSPASTKFWDPTYGKMVWPKATKFGTVAHVA